MDRADNQLMPILQMLDQYQTAPMVGELTPGGYAYLGAQPAKNEFVGAISFGELRGGDYNLASITSRYTEFNQATLTQTCDAFQQQILASLSCGFSNLNLVLIYLTRARQMQKPMRQLMTTSALTTFRQEFNATIQLYYFVQLLGTHIFPDFFYQKQRF